MNGRPLTLVSVCWLTLSCLSWILCSRGFAFKSFALSFPLAKLLLLLLARCSKEARLALISRSSIIRGSARFNCKRSLKSLPLEARSDFSLVRPSKFRLAFSDSTAILSTDFSLLSSSPSFVRVWTLSRLLSSPSLFVQGKLRINSSGKLSKAP